MAGAQGTGMAGGEELVVPLARAEGAGRVGTKAARLGLLLRDGLPVPPGCVLTTGCYDLLLREDDLAPRLEALAAAAAPGPAGARAASRAIAELFARAHLPPALAAAITAAFELTAGGGGARSRAVRSSAVDEDLREASFAGQLTTTLGVADLPALERAVIACWAGPWSPRSLAYRGARGLGPPRGIAVLVQALVPADAAGVLFTADPLRGDRSVAVIEAVWGLGASLVDGLVTPDRWVVDKASGRVREWAPGDKATALLPGAGGVQEVSIEEDRRRLPALSARELEGLLALAARVEGLFQEPQDIEWALCGGAPFLLQARPLAGVPRGAIPESSGPAST